jgi:PEP-CTERM motif-containing protein
MRYRSAFGVGSCRLLLVLFVTLPMFGDSLLSGLSGTVYWYNGDPDANAYSTNGDGIFPNGYGGLDDASLVWDDFNVGPGGAVITGVFSLDEFAPFGSGSIAEPYQATWQILNGPPGSGTVVAQSSLSTSGVNITDTGQPLITSGPYAGELYRTEVTGLDVNLAPGTYWLYVLPDSDGGQFFIPTTAGANGIGSPQAQDGNAWFTCCDVYLNQAVDNYASDPADGGHVDFSMGVEGASVPSGAPEPGTLLLMSGGLVVAAFAKRRRPARP